MTENDWLLFFVLFIPICILLLITGHLAFWDGYNYRIKKEWIMEIEKRK